MLFEQGKKKKEIARFLKIDVKTVRRIIEHGPGEVQNRSDTQNVTGMYSACMKS